MSIRPVVQCISETNKLYTLDESRKNNIIYPSELVSDSTGKGYEGCLNMSRSLYAIATGYIADTCPYLYCYKVAIDGLTNPILCSVLQIGGGDTHTMSDASTYACGASVVVAVHTHSGTGIILGSAEGPRDQKVFHFKYFIDNATRVLGDPTEKGIAINDKDKSSLMDCSHGKFLDTTDGAEFCKHTYTGMQLFLDPFMASMSANDYTGLWVFEQDSLTRLSGAQLQLRSLGFEKEYLEDVGEYIEYEGSVLYPWESLGFLKKPSDDLIKEEPIETWHVENSIQSYCEPVEKHTQPFHRVMTLGGWLGQGKQTSILLPPKDKDWFHFGDKDPVNCLSRVTQSVDGLLSMESAKGILITKRGMFPGATRVERPDEPLKKKGDNEENYKPDEFKLPKDMKNLGKHDGITRALGLSDYTGYNLNWKNIFPVAYHKKDFSIAEESKLDKKSFFIPDFSSLKSKQYLKDEKKYTLDIDDKRKEQEFHETEAGIALLPEGGVVIYDGYGGEIRMVGGSITISAPGDISIKSGRSSHVWSGQDTIIRSNKTIELSSTEESIRIKAEKNMELLGGNGGEGSVIIESRGKGQEYDFSKIGDDIKAAGIILKAGNAAVAAEGSSVYLRSGATGSGSGIYLDAQKGKDTVYVFSSDVKEYVKKAHTITFIGEDPDDTKVTTRFTENSTELNGNLTVPGNLFVEEGAFIGSTVISLGVYISTEAPLVTHDTKNEAKFAKLIDDMVKIPEETLPQENKEHYTGAVDPKIYKQKKIGNETVLKDTGFSFRSKEQMKLPSDYAIYEDRWQNMVTNSGKNSSVWKEKSVKAANNQDTYPFPGKPYYTTDPEYITQVTTIADFRNNQYKDRMEDKEPTIPYKEPKFGDQTPKSLNSYKIL